MNIELLFLIIYNLNYINNIKINRFLNNVISNIKYFIILLIRIFIPILNNKYIINLIKRTFKNNLIFNKLFNLDNYYNLY